MSARRSESQKVIIFILLLCFVCALLLSVVAYTLRTPQKLAKEFDQSKQMLIAARLLSHEGYFLVKGERASSPATSEEIQAFAKDHIHPLLTDNQGNVYTIEEKNITLADYLSSNTKMGYANLPLKLFYAITSPTEKTLFSAEEIAKDLSHIEIVVIPVSGFGLWAPIYGFMALAPDGNRVVGTTWYDMAETPGLGANITESWWQSEFEGKLIFHETADGKSDFATAEMGIIVVKGKVRDVYGETARAKSAVDGLSGATLTGDGVTAAYKNSLTPYRAFLIKLHQGRA